MGIVVPAEPVVAKRGGRHQRCDCDERERDPNPEKPVALGNDGISGGQGSGLYKSTDGGDHWEKMKEGLPEKMGKMSIAVCRSNSEKVYALIESDSETEHGGGEDRQLGLLHRRLYRGGVCTGARRYRTALFSWRAERLGRGTYPR